VTEENAEGDDDRRNMTPGSDVFSPR
jgi:hypothetical protein